MPFWILSGVACGSLPSHQVGEGVLGTADRSGALSRIFSHWPLSPPIGGPLPQASPVSVYLFPGERSGAQAPLPPPGGSSHTLESCSKAKEHEKEEEGDGDTLDSDEFCILDAPGLGIAVCVGMGVLSAQVAARPF